MFIGHFAVALAAKRVAPKTSLGTLFMSVQLVDLLWPIFLLLGLEHVMIEPGNTAFTPLNFYNYPITHSLVGAIAWSILFGGVYFLLRHYNAGAWAVGLGVFSHWLLDLLTHRPDLPLGFDTNTFFGLGLWNSVPATLVIELTIFAVGIFLYSLATRANDQIGTYSLWSLVGFLLIVYFMNVFGPPPPSEEMIAIAGNAIWLIVLWGYWIDRHRANIEPQPME